MQPIEVYSIASTVVAGIFAYMLYRQQEIVNLVLDIIEAMEDKKITEEEFQEIMNDLKQVIYKKSDKSEIYQKIK